MGGEDGYPASSRITRRQRGKCSACLPLEHSSQTRRCGRQGPRAWVKIPKAQGKPESERKRRTGGHGSWQRSQGRSPLEQRPQLEARHARGPERGADSGPQTGRGGSHQKTNGQMAERRHRLQPPLGKLIKPSISAGLPLSAPRGTQGPGCPAQARS